MSQFLIGMVLRDLLIVGVVLSVMSQFLIGMVLRRLSGKNIPVSS